MKNVKLLMFLLILGNFAFGARTYVKGHISIGNDTINCYVEEDVIYKGRVRYKLSIEDKKPLKMNANLISQIKCGKDIYDRIFLSAEDTRLMKRIVYGEISLYKWYYVVQQGGGGNMTSGVSVSVGYSSISYQYYLKTYTELIKYKSIRHRKNILKLFEENASLWKEINELDRKDHEEQLADIIKRYNVWHKNNSK